MFLSQRRCFDSSSTFLYRREDISRRGHSYRPITDYCSLYLRLLKTPEFQARALATSEITMSEESSAAIASFNTKSHRCSSVSSSRSDVREESEQEIPEFVGFFLTFLHHQGFVNSQLSVDLEAFEHSLKNLNAC